MFDGERILVTGETRSIKHILARMLRIAALTLDRRFLFSRHGAKPHCMRLAYRDSLESGPETPAIIDVPTIWADERLDPEQPAAYLERAVPTTAAV